MAILTSKKLGRQFSLCISTSRFSLNVGLGARRSSHQDHMCHGHDGSRMVAEKSLRSGRYYSAI